MRSSRAEELKKPQVGMCSTQDYACQGPPIWLGKFCSRPQEAHDLHHKPAPAAASTLVFPAVQAGTATGRDETCVVSPNSAASEYLDMVNRWDCISCGKVNI